MSRIVILCILTPMNQTCPSTNQVVAGCKKLLQKQKKVFFLKQNLYMLHVLPLQGKLVLQQVMLILCMV